jgi:hypothetical protein
MSDFCTNLCFSENTPPKYIAKMSFIYNALENGWTIKKHNDSYVFTKKHEGKKEMLSEDYLSTFMKDNFHAKMT